jgi:hypothetical protein
MVDGIDVTRGRGPMGGRKLAGLMKADHRSGLMPTLFAVDCTGWTSQLR